MDHSLDRRNFLKTGAVLGAGLGLSGLGGIAAAEEAPARKNSHAGAEKLGWRLGCQAWSFNSYTFFEAIDKTAGLGLCYIEAFPGQKISKEITAGFGDGLSSKQRQTIKQKLSDSGVKLVNFGVTGISGRKTFDFAKDMGIETIVSEPDEGDFQELDKLCREYEINVAIHDHPKPSHYWNPDTVLKVTKGLSKRIGACCDTGHWPRSGLNALDCLKKLQGRIISFHFKDLDKTGGDAHDVPWGTGINNVKGMLTEIRRQGVKAVFSIEYEYNMDHSLPEIAQCVAYFDKVANELAG
ncbi:MAG: sugar phosphate isomerase/epimerase family protein [Thermoguttaceae bacterium]